MLNTAYRTCSGAPASFVAVRNSAITSRASPQKANSAAFRTFSSCNTLSSNRKFIAKHRSQPSHRAAIGGTPSAAMKVAVTGAGGQTGGLVVQRLHDKQCEVVAIGRSSQSLKQMADSVTRTIVDITSPDAARQMEDALKGVEALVIATSAKPQLNPKSADTPGPPSFFYPEGQMPEQVDYEGQVLQIDAAKAAGVKHVVIVSSMGGTDESNRLNALGNGKILVWKRKAEEYLIASGLTYTILHPGGLFNEKGGQRQIVLGVDDELLAKAESEGSSRRIPRDDVAALTVAALFVDAAKNRSVDAVAKEPADGSPTEDFSALYTDLTGDCKY